MSAYKKPKVSNIIFKKKINLACDGVCDTTSLIECDCA